MVDITLEEEALISTDVDRLIRTISEKQRVGVHELERLCSIDGKTLDKWVKVLEDEGYISLEYGLTGTYILWKGISDVDIQENNIYVPDSDEEVKQPVLDKKIEQKPEITPITEEKQTETTEKQPEPKDSVTDESVREYTTPNNQNVDEIEESKPEEETELVTKEETHEPKQNPVESGGDIKSHILGKLSEDDPTKNVPDVVEEPRKELIENEVGDLPETNERTEVLNEELGEDVEEMTPEEIVSSSTDESENIEKPEIEETVEAQPAMENVIEKPTPVMEVVEEPDVDESEDEPDEPSEPRVIPPIAKPQRLTDSGKSMKELVNAYLGEINKEKMNIEKLKKKKDDLYRKKILDLESRIEADIVSATERILDKEGRILELKERVLELPDKVDEVDKLYKTMEKLRTESNSSMQAAKQKAEECIQSLKESETEIRQKIDAHRTVIKSESAKVEDLESLGTSVQTKLGTTKEALEATKIQMDELNNSMQGLLSDMEEATEMKVEIFEMSDKLKESLAEKETELDDLEQHLEQIRQVEQWTKEYVTDYETKVGEIEKYVLAGDDDLAKLRESAEAEYIKKYLRELEGMTRDYEKELHDAVEAEQDIDEAIASSKKRLTELVQESQEMIKKLRKDVKDIPDFSDSSGEAKNRIEKMRSLVDEKSEEREKLKADYTKARKSPREMKVKAKVKKKLSKKKNKKNNKKKGKKKK